MKEKFIYNLETVLAKFCEVTGKNKSEVQQDAIGSHSFMSVVRKDANFTIERYCALYQYLHDNWPDEHKWPIDCILPDFQYPPSEESDAENITHHK